MCVCVCCERVRTHTRVTRACTDAMWPLLENSWKFAGAIHKGSNRPNVIRPTKDQIGMDRESPRGRLFTNFLGTFFDHNSCLEESPEVLLKTVCGHKSSPLPKTPGPPLGNASELLEARWGQVPRLVHAFSRTFSNLLQPFPTSDLLPPSPTFLYPLQPSLTFSNLLQLPRTSPTSSTK